MKCHIGQFYCIKFDTEILSNSLITDFYWVYAYNITLFFPGNVNLLLDMFQPVYEIPISIIAPIDGLTV